MLNNSLFSLYLRKNGLSIYKHGSHKRTESKTESTRDIICLDFDFGSHSCQDELNRLNSLLNEDLSEQSKERIKDAIQRVQSKKDFYTAKKREEIRDQFYNEGVTVTYKGGADSGPQENRQTIHYKMLFRTCAKAKSGQVIFINSALYDKAHDWLTMGLESKMPPDNARIVELSAYAPLTASTITGTLHIPVEDILILKDQDSFFKTIANVVKASDYTDTMGKKKKKCIVTQEETKLKNTIWDGMGIIESDMLPDWVNGMALLRNHFFKMCGLRGHLQLFFRDWCREKGYDPETYQVQDMFGQWHYLKNIKMITTDNAVKWIKFMDLMGDTPESAYAYWCDRIRADGNIWGIVKTDHVSRYGEYQQLSYQMLNTLPCTRTDIAEIARTSMDYVALLKKNNAEFVSYLRKNANEFNHYAMLADLYDRNPVFGSSKWFRHEKTNIINSYIRRLRKGKLLVKGDNLTVFGNPYSLLLYSVGEDWRKDPTLKREDGCIQCFTSRFRDGEYLAAFRSPHNSPNNVCYMHNVYSHQLQKYFRFSPNIAAINCIETDIQDRANGMDEDSDFMLFTSQPAIVACAKKCYEEYPTIVNALKESRVTYHNTKTDYADLDHRLSGSQLGIGWSSNLAQLAMTYYWTEKTKEHSDEGKLRELCDNFIILSVLAQIIIDNCKREYEINGMEELRRISRLPCMTLVRETQELTMDNRPKTARYDYPKFMKYIKETDGSSLESRINPQLQCPMNWLEECLDTMKRASTSDTIPTIDFFVKMSGKPNNRQMTKIRSMIEEYDHLVKALRIAESDEEILTARLTEESDLLLEKLKKIKITNFVTINRLVETALGLETGVGASRKLMGSGTRYTRKILNYLYKLDKARFLDNFKSKAS